MKVVLKSSWTHAQQGKTYPGGTELEIEDRFFNKDYHEKVKAVAKKKTTPKKSK